MCRCRHRSRRGRWRRRGGDNCGGGYVRRRWRCCGAGYRRSFGYGRGRATTPKPPTSEQGNCGTCHQQNHPKCAPRWVVAANVGCHPGLGVQARHGAALTLGVGALQCIKNVGHGSVGRCRCRARAGGRCSGRAFQLHESHRAGLPIGLEPLRTLECAHPAAQRLIEHQRFGAG